MSDGSRYILAVDQSTSATKALVYTLSGDLIDRFIIEHSAIYPKPGWVEHDAELLWRNTLSVIRLALEKHSNPLCLSITNQRETFVIFDRTTGRPLCPAVVWQCRRGDSVCAELLRGGHGDFVARKTGLKIDSYFSAPKLMALLRMNPGLREQLHAGDALFGTIDTYLLYRLTAGKVFATDSTNASRTLLYNINTLAWDPQLCDLFKISIDALPKVLDSSSRFGTCDCASLPATLPIAGVMGDSQAALFAHRCFGQGQAKVTLGTGSSILLNTGPRLPESGIRTIAWTRHGKPTYCLEGVISCSGAVIAWLRDQLGLIQSPGETDACARAVPDNGGVYFVPAFTGLSSPHWCPAARAAIVGLSASSTRNHVIRAALESIAYQIKDALDALTQQSQIPLLQIHADGGASRNMFLMQFIADILGTEITLSDVRDFSPLGAALAGMVAMGVYESFEQLGTLPISENAVRPRMSLEAAAALHTGWNRAVDQVLAGAGAESKDEICTR